MNGIKVIKFSYRSKIQILLDGFDALGRDFSQVGTLWKEAPEHPNTVFHRPFILGAVRTGEVGISIELFGDVPVTGKRLVVVKGQGFDEGGWYPAQPLGDSVGNPFGFTGSYFLQGRQQGGPIGQHQQGRFMSLAHHKIDFNVTQPRTLLDHFGALGDRYSAFNPAPAVLSVAAFGFSPTVFEVLVEGLVGGISRAFGCPDPLVDGLVGNPIDTQGAPAAANQLRREFFFDEPLAGLGLESVGKTLVFRFVSVATVGQLLGMFRAIMLALRPFIGYITFEFPTDCRAMYTEGSGNLALGMACIEQGFDLMTIFYAELGVFLHDNTNITRLAEDLRGIPLRSYFVLHLLLELRTQKVQDDRFSYDIYPSDLVDTVPPSTKTNAKRIREVYDWSTAIISYPPNIKETAVDFKLDIIRSKHTLKHDGYHLGFITDKRE